MSLHIGIVRRDRSTRTGDIRHKGNKYQEEMERIEVLRRELEELGYTSVWVGEIGMTAEGLLQLQDENDAGPEYMRLEPGELVGVEGRSGGGIRMPRPGGRRIDAPEVLRHLGGVQPEAEFELRREAAHTQAAKRGNVLVYVADVIEWKAKDLLSREDMFFLLKRAGTGQKAPNFALKDLPPVVRVFTDPRYEEVPLDGLAPEHVDEEFLDGVLRPRHDGSPT